MAVVRYGVVSDVVTARFIQADAMVITRSVII